MNKCRSSIVKGKDMYAFEKMNLFGVWMIERKKTCRKWMDKIKVPSLETKCALGLIVWIHP